MVYPSKMNRQYKYCEIDGISKEYDLFSILKMNDKSGYIYLGYEYMINRFESTELKFHFYKKQEGNLS